MAEKADIIVPHASGTFKIEKNTFERIQRERQQGPDQADGGLPQNELANDDLPFFSTLFEATKKLTFYLDFAGKADPMMLDIGEGGLPSFFQGIFGDVYNYLPEQLEKDLSSEELSAFKAAASGEERDLIIERLRIREATRALKGDDAHLCAAALLGLAVIAGRNKPEDWEKGKYPKKMANTASKLAFRAAISTLSHIADGEDRSKEKREFLDYMTREQASGKVDLDLSDAMLSAYRPAFNDLSMSIFASDTLKLLERKDITSESVTRELYSLKKKEPTQEVLGEAQSGSDMASLNVEGDNIENFQSRDWELLPDGMLKPDQNRPRVYITRQVQNGEEVRVLVDETRIDRLREIAQIMRPADWEATCRMAVCEMGDKSVQRDGSANEMKYHAVLIPVFERSEVVGYDAVVDHPIVGTLNRDAVLAPDADGVLIPTIRPGAQNNMGSTRTRLVTGDTHGIYVFRFESGYVGSGDGWNLNWDTVLNMQREFARAAGAKVFFHTGNPTERIVEYLTDPDPKLPNLEELSRLVTRLRVPVQSTRVRE